MIFGFSNLCWALDCGSCCYFTLVTLFVFYTCDRLLSVFFLASERGVLHLLIFERVLVGK